MSGTNTPQQDGPTPDAVPFWPLPILSVMVLLIFAGTLAALFFRALPDGSVQIVNVLLGILGGMTSAVIQYWFGSSAGSARKNEYLIHAKNKLDQAQSSSAKTSP